MKAKGELAGYDECICVTRVLMGLSGLWPDTYCKNVLSICHTIIVPFSILFVMVIPQIKRAIIVRSDFNDLLELLSLALVIVAICLMKFVGMCYYNKDLKTLLVGIMDDWRNATEDEQRAMWRNARLTRYIVSVCIFSTCINIVLLMIRAWVNYHADLKHVGENGTAIKPLLMQAHFDFDYQPTPIYQIVFVAQAAASYWASFVYSAYDGFFISTILHYTGQLYNLQFRVEHLTEEQTKKNCSFVDVLASVIQRHRQLCKYLDLIEQNFNKIFLIQILAVSVVICLQGYQFVTALSESGLADLVFTAFYVSGSLINLFLYCYIVEQLRSQCENLFLSIFKMKWYELPIRESKLLIIFMRKTEQPVEITVGKFTPFSLEYFCSVIKTSGGYLSMLLAMRTRILED